MTGIRLRAGAAIVMALALPFWATAVSAHPHVFIDARPTLKFEAGRLVAIELDWLFDEVFSDQLTQEFGVDHKARFGAAEIAKLRAGAFDNLKNYDYFTHVRADGHAIAFSGVEQFTAEARGKLVAYRFTARLATPLDPRTQAVKIGLYDADYYVEVGVAAGAVTKLDKAPEGCAVKKINDKSNPIYLGSVFPETLVVTCPAS